MAEVGKNEDVNIAEFLRLKKKEACRLIDSIMREIGSPERLSAAPLNQLSSVLGTLIDKFGAGEKDIRGDGTLSELFRDFEDVN